MKRICSLFLAVAFALSVTLPTYAQVAFRDVDKQDGGHAGVEHYVFWKTYYYALEENTNKAINYYTPSVLYNYVTTAVGRWNAVKPNHAYNMNPVSTSDMADMRFVYSACPTSASALGCNSVSQWLAMASHSVSVWYKTTIYIKPSAPNGPYWYTSTLNAAVGHEIGHSLGLADMYNLWDGCDPNVFTMMDGANTVNNYYVACDSESPTQWDIDRWSDYHFTRYHTYDTYNLWGDGTVITYWKDEAWNDYMLQTHWYWGNGAGGTFTWFAQSGHINYNGSHYTVPPASAWRPNAWLNPGDYNVHTKYLKVCTYAVFDWGAVGPERCSPSFFYPY